MVLNKNPGSALIVALLVLTLVSFIATALMISQQSSLITTRLLLNEENAYWSLKAIESWGLEYLSAESQSAETVLKTTGLMPPIIDSLPYFFYNKALGQAVLSGGVWDAQGRFNLNDLNQKAYQKIFTRLIETVDNNIRPSEAERLTKAVVAYLNRPHSKKVATDKTNQAIDKNTTDKTNKLPPNLFVSSSELRLVKGFGPNLYQRLSSFIIALPSETPLNINAIQAPVIASLSSNCDLYTAQSLVDNRRTQPYQRLNDFIRDLGAGDGQLPTEVLTLNSEYFLIRSQVKIDSQAYRMQTLVYRPLPQVTQKLPLVAVLWESRGGL